MAETTSQETVLTRGAAADLLRTVADELDSDRNRIHVTIGNKAVGLSPPERITVETSVTERSRRIRKDVESLDLGLQWNPTSKTDEKETPEATTDRSAETDSQ